MKRVIVHHTALTADVFRDLRRTGALRYQVGKRLAGGEVLQDGRGIRSTERRVVVAGWLDVR